jgi:hypothetical protein
MQSALTIRMRRMALAGLSVAWIAAAPAALAQAPAPAAPVQTQPANISDQKLDAAAAALEKVSGLKQSYEQKLSSASAGEREKIANEASDALSRAVTDQGLSVEEYNSIIQVAQNDPQVRQKILSRVKPR